MNIKRYLIIYDISNNKKRRKIQLQLEKFGFRWQYSTYYCEVSPRQITEVRNNLIKIIDKTDSIIWIPLTIKLIKPMDFIGKFKFEIDEINMKIF